ncbi:hypothetical protein RHODO2019_06145 [Rhodococcus antarcticus]|uniref:Uncharacterized protein n=1 Tax=Rhodococcus antarcticus TaxID=2987751 RepID=A0ABY6P2Y5_9NOCA|nr:hypothetical protein [Rhodococcus antarcticus]UZJ26010.1 hypothetical protein RHODO2019_06145 [Rhodococcus antarcticus]
MFVTSMFPPLALGFFGLGTGYLVWGPMELLGFPPRDAAVDRAAGFWGIWLAGFCQLVTGVILFVGLTWFPVFTNDKALYMAALAFSAYGIHWFVLGWNRYRGNDDRPNAGMSVAFMVLSALGAFVFYHGGAWPVGLLFTGLFLVYLAELFVALQVGPVAVRAIGFFHTVTGVWLMYLTVAVVLNTVIGYSLPA